MNDSKTNKPLSGRTAIVTGASSGIGRATALALVQAGAAVVIYARRKDRLEELASEISGLGGKSLIVSGDAGVQADIDLLLNRSLSWNDGGCKYDILVANAGRGLASGVISTNLAKWQEVYQVNVFGAAYLMRQAGQYMVQRKSGDIVAVGSVAGRNVSPFSGFYGSSKFAIGAIAEGLRREICSYGVNAVELSWLPISRVKLFISLFENSFITSTRPDCIDTFENERL
ncbi:MAG: SDR family NAD(P)-dependent oxidoreductase, partial [Desulfobacterales bacterium]